MKRSKLAVVAALVLTLALSACKQTTGDGDTDKRTLSVWFMGDQTGPNKSLCIGPGNTTKLLIEQANKKGDLPVKLAFKWLDTQGDKDKAKTAVGQVTGDKDVVAVVGPCFSGESATTGPDLEAAHIPHLTPSATDPSLAAQGWTFWYRLLANDSIQSAGTPDVLYKYGKATKVFIGHDNSQYGKGLATLVMGELAKAGKPEVGIEAVQPGQENYGDLVTKVINSRADAFYWAAYEKEAGLILKQLKARGFTGKFYAADGSKGADFLKVGGADANGATITCPCLDPNVSADPDALKFAADYKAEFGEGPTIYGAEARDLMDVLFAAIDKAGAPGSDLKAYRDKVNANVRSTTLKGITREISFETSGELKGTPGLYLYTVENGAYKLLGFAAELSK